MKLYIINGPNLNMLGIREPEKYGDQSYSALCNMIKAHCESLGCETVFFQSNHEGDLVDKIQEAYFEGADGIVINPGAYTHTSIALLDAVLSVRIPTVEVHLTDIATRESFRQFSYISLYAEKLIKGKGFEGYREALEYLINR